MDTLQRRASQLPPQPTSFVGRDRERAELRARLAALRLLTLTGVGGSGKTRLARQVAEDVLDLYPDGITWVDLAGLSEGSLVPQAVALAVGLAEQPGRTALDSLLDTLRPRAMLLVLDNCEHLVATCASLVARILRQCQGVRLLATSREPLGVAGEHVWPVPPLSVLSPEVTPSALPLRGLRSTLNSALSSEAAQLFVERAQQVQPSFTLTDATAPTVARLVRRLDGIPLAIELAAARIASLSLDQIADHLDDLLTVGSDMGGGHARHRTLRAALDWSYQLLSDPERALFRHLSVFAGGFTLDSAEALMSDMGQVTGNARLTRHSSPITDDVLDLLTRLVDKSLLVTMTQGDTTRYRLLEPVRQYAWDKLTEADEAIAASQAHAAVFLQLAEAAEPHLRGREQQVWMQRLASENDNLRAALTRSLEDRGWRMADSPLDLSERSSLLAPRSSIALRLAGALWYFWYVRGQMSEGRRWLEAALAWAEGRAGAEQDDATTLTLWAKARHGIGALALRQGDYDVARAAFEAALRIRETLGDRRGAAYTLNNLGTLADTLGDIDQARTRFEAALAVFRDQGDAWGISLELNNLGQVAYQMGDIEAAHRLYRESLSISREIGDGLRTALALNNLGKLATRRGDLGLALIYHQESLDLTQSLGEKRTLAETLGFLCDVALGEGRLEEAWSYLTQSLQTYQHIGERSNLATGLERRARLALAVSDAEKAARLLGAAQKIRDSLHVPLKSPDREDVAGMISAIEQRLGASVVARLVESAAHLPLEATIALALEPLPEPAQAPSSPPPTALLPSNLTARERDVALLVAQGHANRAVAETLRIGERTVETHISHILGKLGFTSRAQIAEWVNQHAP